MPRQAFVGAFLCYFACISNAVSQPHFTVVDLGAASSTDDSRQAINNSGTVAFWEDNGIYVYQGGASSLVPGLVAGNSGPIALNDQGDIGVSNEDEAVLDRAGSFTQINLGEYTFVGGLNDSDVLVGEYYPVGGSAYRAFAWQSGTATFLPSPGGTTYGKGNGSSANSINNQGVIAGTYDPAEANESAIIWNASGGALLPTLNGYTVSGANSINDSNVAVGFSATSAQQSQAVIWENDGVQSLGSLAGLPYSVANAIDDNGDVVGGAQAEAGPGLGDAFLWQSGTMYDLNSLIPANSGWHLSDAYDVNADEIVGVGTFGGSQQAFLLIPVPEPVTFSTLFVGACFVLSGRSFRRMTANSERRLHRGG